MKIIRWIKVHSVELILATFLLPALITLIIFQLIPTIWTIWFSFTDMALIGKRLIHPRFIGLENYVKLLNDPIFWQSMKVTFEYCLASLVLRFVLGLLAALYLTSKTFKGKTLMAAVFLLPYIIPGVIHPYVWISMLDTRYGTLNRILLLFGLPSQSWVYKRAMESVIMINSWAGYALAMLVLASAITSIPKEYYEVAEIYGASRWQRFTKITLPLIKYPVMLSMILIFKEDIDDFTYVYMFTEGGPHYRTELLSLYAYHKAFAYFELGYGCAVGFVIAILVFILTLAQLKLGGT
ncbi:MAG: hypothetical protein DRJ37_02020 [Thermoprotei archaeon]|nr:MAG: hypothetical protein DRJ37_02020 [Thermoprotei archaeon]